MHEQIAAQFGVAEDLPCADTKFLAPLKRSQEFRGLRARLAGERPHPVVDSWLDDGFHFFVFQLETQGGDLDQDAISLAVFAMHPDQVEPVSAVTVEPLAATREARITNVRDPQNSYVAPLPG